MNSILDAPVATEQKLEYAGFWIRLVAIMIDGIVLSVVIFFIAFAVGVAAFALESVGLLISIYFLYIIMVAAYFTLMESSVKQATLGKMAVGIKVGDEHGQRISAANALGRWASKLLSGLILYIGYIMAGFDPKKQALHDKIAQTVVFYGN
jgi:uncharacterized RDD family membrane protein YckC